MIEAAAASTAELVGFLAPDRAGATAAPAAAPAGEVSR
jgi:hypothetical protein